MAMDRRQVKRLQPEVTVQMRKVTTKRVHNKFVGESLAAFNAWFSNMMKMLDMSGATCGDKRLWWIKE